MQEEKEKMVDIDTSGPGADIDLPEEKQEDVVETKEDSSSAPQEPREEKVEASDEKPEAKEQKDELQDYSKDVQRRIAKLTKKWREAERQREDALTFARIQKDKAEELSKKYETLESASLKSREEKLKSSLEAAKIKLASARDAGDINLEFEAQRELANAGYEEARLKELKALAESQPKQVVTPSDVRIPQQPQQVVDPRAEDWASKNTWFGKDKAMTYTAFDIHRTLVEEEGYDPKSDEYYAEIDKRIRLDFPHKFVNNSDKVENNTTKPTQIVASAKRSVNTGRKTVRLTPSQVAIAKKLGVPLEEYAKQLKITKEV